ncbi:unnamed protein product [Amoebophrya sp. A25]|nr:unnamed protein product [Amoebophrya sp. A25]|eukprot:GSA25T00016194001.1
MASFSSSNRMAHWVLRVSELEKTWEFLKSVFGMVVIRHEENDAACKITCNGKFDRPWSKTMMGFPQHTEDKWYCLELTYNYGVKKYPTDGGIAAISVAVPDPASALDAAKKLGYEIATSGAIVGPDAYPYMPVAFPDSSRRKEPFMSVTIVVNDLVASKKWYAETLDMVCISESDTEATMGYSVPSPTDTTYVILQQRPQESDAIVPGAHSGRLAISCPDVSKYYARFPEKQVLHELQILDEPLGKLEIAIVADPDGFELCLVTSAVFDPSTRDAATWSDPDWDSRRKMGGK